MQASSGPADGAAAPRQEGVDSSNRVNIRVATMGGRELELELEATTTVAQVLAEAVPLIDEAPLERRRLVLGTEELGERSTLAELGVGDGARLSLVQSRRRCLVAAERSEVRLLCMDSATCLRTLKGHSRRVTDISSEGQSAVLTASEDGTAKLWCASSGACVCTFTGHTAEVQSVRFSPDGREVLTAAEDGAAKVWCRASGACLLTLKHAKRRGSFNYLALAAFLPGGQQLFTWIPNVDLRIWCRTSGERLRSIEGVHRAPAFSPGGGQLLIAPREGDILVWSAAGESNMPLVGREDERIGLAISNDGTQVLLVIADSAKIWSAARAAFQTLEGYDGVPSVAAFSPDGQRLLTTGISKAKLWSPATGECLLTLPTFGPLLGPAIFAPDGELLLAGDARVRSCITGECIFHPHILVQEPMDFLR